MSYLACSLPSATSAAAVVEGQPGALPRAAAHMVMRGAIIASGIVGADRLYAALDPDVRPLPLGRATLLGMGASAAIETYILGWMVIQSRLPRLDDGLLASYRWGRR